MNSASEFIHFKVWGLLTFKITISVDFGQKAYKFRLSECLINIKISLVL